MIKDGKTDIPPGKIAAVITHLEMLEPVPPRPAPSLPGLSVRPVTAPDTGWYRDLYARVGAHGSLWTSRLNLEPRTLETIIHDPRVEIFTLSHQNIGGGAPSDQGLLELDFRVDGECELAFFGVTVELIGQGAGRMLMNHALAHVWSRRIRRFWLHTCTHDHPGALSFYIRTGFRAFRRQIEITDDPRLTGLIPQSAAPHVPIIE